MPKGFRLEQLSMYVVAKYEILTARISANSIGTFQRCFRPQVWPISEDDTEKRAEKDIQIAFYKQLRDRRKTDDEHTTEGTAAPPFVLNPLTVFNVEQCDGLTLPPIEQPTQPNEVEVDELREPKGGTTGLDV
jgi:hypothetical protein